MTATKQVSFILSCDWPACDRTIVAEVTSENAARYWVAGKGWFFKNRKDYCNQHAAGAGKGSA